MRKPRHIREPTKPPQPQPAAAGTAVLQIMLPPHAVPGKEFDVFVCGQIIRVCCPQHCRAGQTVAIRVQAHPLANQQVGDETRGLRRIYEKDAAGKMPAYVVPVPEGLRPGQTFPVKIQGPPAFAVRVPQTHRPGMLVQFRAPPLTALLVKQEYGPSQVQTE